VLGVSGREVAAPHPHLEVLLGAPAGEDEADLTVVVGPQQLEPLESGGLLDLARTRGKPVRELIETFTWNGDGVDLDDRHGEDPTVPIADALDNPAYAALTSRQADLAEVRGRVRRYPPDVAPFLAMPPEATADDWCDAAELIGPGGFAGIVHDDPPPDGWSEARRFGVTQMITSDAIGQPDPEAVVLGAADVPEMLELVAATEPGPFLERTIVLGTYLGLRREGALVAMAGERMHMNGWTEISAVCTLPAFRGQRFASRLVSDLIARIGARDERPFLHVMTSNASAIAVYEALGFTARRTATIAVLVRADAI
jgi:ribosomal protein S18 acetylase RimI-like enzyme